jgi:hypothetical protein
MIEREATRLLAILLLCGRCVLASRILSLALLPSLFAAFAVLLRLLLLLLPPLVLAGFAALLVPQPFLGSAHI